MARRSRLPITTRGDAAAMLALAALATGACRSVPPAAPSTARSSAMPGDPAPFAAAIESLAARLESGYVYPEVGARYAAMLRANLARGAYRDASDRAALAAQLTAELQAVSADKHLRVEAHDDIGWGRRDPASSAGPAAGTGTGRMPGPRPGPTPTPLPTPASTLDAGTGTGGMSGPRPGPAPTSPTPTPTSTLDAGTGTGGMPGPAPGPAPTPTPGAGTSTGQMPGPGPTPMPMPRPGPGAGPGAGPMRMVPPPGEGVSPNAAPPPGGGPRRGGPPIEEARWIADGVAYIRFRAFASQPDTIAAVSRFMTDYAGAKALIIDARALGGGGPGEMGVMLPHLFAAETLLVYMDVPSSIVRRMGPPPADPSLREVAGPPGVTRRAHVVQPSTTERRWFGARVFYLTSSRTASAGEHLALALKRTHRATLIGERTAGANHFGGLEPLGDGLAAFIPIGRTLDPDTGRDWEGTGIEPDVAVPADVALTEALARVP